MQKIDAVAKLMMFSSGKNGGGNLRVSGIIGRECHPKDLFHARFEISTEGGQSVEHARADGLFAATDGIGDLAVGHSVPNTHHNDGPLFGGELTYGGLDQSGGFKRDGRFHRGRIGRGGAIVAVVFDRQRERIVPAEIRPAFVHRDPQEPGAEGKGITVATAENPNGQKNLLEKLFGPVPIADHPLDKGQQRGGMASHQSIQRLVFAAGHFPHQAFIRVLFLFHVPSPLPSRKLFAPGGGFVVNIFRHLRGLCDKSNFRKRLGMEKFSIRM
jgi:hypothetical protein